MIDNLVPSSTHRDGGRGMEIGEEEEEEADVVRRSKPTSHNDDGERLQ